MRMCLLPPVAKGSDEGGPHPPQAEGPPIPVPALAAGLAGARGVRGGGRGQRLSTQGEPPATGLGLRAAERGVKKEVLTLL